MPAITGIENSQIGKPVDDHATETDARSSGADVGSYAINSSFFSNQCWAYGLSL